MAMYVSIPTKGFNEYAEWRPGSKLIQSQHKRLIGPFAHYVAKRMALEVQLAIDTQKYKSKWKPLSKDYLESKRKQGLSTNIWEATEFLKQNITAYRSNDKYVVGVSKRVKHPTSKQYAWKILFWMEFGTTQMPARPLFRPIATGMQKGIRKYWIEFLLSKGMDTSMYR